MNLSELNIELQSYLEGASAQMVADLKPLLLDNGIIYLGNKSRDDVGYFCFEYDYEYLDVTFWACDKMGNRMTETATLPSAVASKADAGSEWNAFLPEHIWDAVVAFEERDDFDEEAEDELDAYHLARCRLFEQWFCACWQQAVGDSGVDIAACFSVHDSYFKTDLRTLQEVREGDMV